MTESRIVALATLPMIIGAVLLIGLRRPDAVAVGAAVETGSAAAGAHSDAAPEPVAGRYLGVIVSGYSADVGSEFGGSVTEVWSSVGSRVAADEKLVKIDPRTVGEEVRVARAKLAQQRSAVERAKVELADSRDVLTRLSGMKDGVSERALVEARAREQRAIAALEEARAGMGMSQARLGQQVTQSRKHVIRAPFAGVLVARFVDPGDVVVPGQVVLRVITEDHYVRFALPADQGSTLSEGDRVRVLDAEGGPSLAGVVSDVRPEVDAAAHMVFARARLQVDAEQQKALIPGMRVEVERVSADKEPEPASPKPSAVEPGREG
ncbi:MAG: efflux RND transporter periplasmic adaptor subunit [Myxococcales bacterium]|nr:efflux RND transporter periplasmic adaptor subunit [Myxococcales bacterium]